MTGIYHKEITGTRIRYLPDNVIIINELGETTEERDRRQAREAADKGWYDRYGGVGGSD